MRLVFFASLILGSARGGEINCLRPKLDGILAKPEYKSEFNEGENVFLSCSNPKEELNGIPEITCQPNGSWGNLDNISCSDRRK